MNAIVVVFVPAGESQLPTEKAALRVVDLWQQRTESANMKGDLRQTSNGDQETSPFWTWFIENPRGLRVR